MNRYTELAIGTFQDVLSEQATAIIGHHENERDVVHLLYAVLQEEVAKQIPLGEGIEAELVEHLAIYAVRAVDYREVAGQLSPSPTPAFDQDEWNARLKGESSLSPVEEATGSLSGATNVVYRRYVAHDRELAQRLGKIAQGTEHVGLWGFSSEVKALTMRLLMEGLREAGHLAKAFAYMTLSYVEWDKLGAALAPGAGFNRSDESVRGLVRRFAPEL